MEKTDNRKIQIIKNCCSGIYITIFEDVSSYTDIIGQTITRKGVSVTIHEVAADKNDLWVAFSVTSDSEKTEEPVFLTDVLINKQEIQLSESYPVLLENGEMQGEVSHYTIEDNIFANEEADVTISVHTASPEEIQKIDESSKSDEYVFEFKTDLKELEANTEIINIDQQIKINENQNLTVSQMRLNDFTSTITRSTGPQNKLQTRPVLKCLQSCFQENRFPTYKFSLIFSFYSEYNYF